MLPSFCRSLRGKKTKLLPQKESVLNLHADRPSGTALNSVANHVEIDHVCLQVLLLQKKGAARADRVQTRQGPVGCRNRCRASAIESIRYVRSKTTSIGWKSSRFWGHQYVVVSGSCVGGTLPTGPMFLRCTTFKQVAPGLLNGPPMRAGHEMQGSIAI